MAKPAQIRKVSHVRYEDCQTPAERAAHRIIYEFYPSGPGERDEVTIIGEMARVVRSFKSFDYESLLKQDASAACDMYFRDLMNPIMHLIYCGRCNDDNIMTGVMKEVIKILEELTSIPDPLA